MKQLTWNQRSKKVIAQNCNTYSKRSDQFVEGVYNTHASNGYSECLQLSDGKEVVDYVCGLGSNIISCSNNYTLPNVKEVILAEKIVEKFPCIDKLKFLKTGSEACQAAVRIARAYQENNIGEQFSGMGTGYHGWHNCFIASEKPGTGTVVELYYKKKNLNEVINCLKTYPHSYQYVIIEPVELSMSGFHIGKLRQIRKLCTKHDIVLIFDEVITGFRTPHYCMSNYLNIQPDIICLGKAMANGFPLAVVGGKAKYMDTPGYFISSTFAGEVTAIENSFHTFKTLTKSALRTLWNNGIFFQKNFNKIDDRLSLYGVPTRAIWEGDELIKAKFWQEMYKEGYLFGKAWFIMLAHTRPVLIKTLKVAERVLKNIDNVELEGELPKEVFKRNHIEKRKDR